MADDRSQARREAATLIGVDIDRLSPADGLRVDMISALRLVIDSEQAAVLSGNQADLGKLNVAVQSLIALLPGKSLPEPSPVEGGPSDPRTIMWETYKQMRDRGALVGEGYDGKVLENERLKAKIAELELAVSGDPPGSGGTVAAAADNVVTLRPSPGASNDAPPSAPAPSKPAPPAPAPATGLITDNTTPEPWRDYLNASYDRWADNRR
jgi:hypothetical protein